INVAAHELRTPLTVIKGYSQMLKSFIDPANIFPLEGIESGIERITEVVNNMLDMAKIDTQSLDMKKQPTRLREIVDKIEREFRKALKERNITLKRSGFITLPVIQADAEMLTKVFRNLVVNAIKYTPDNGQVTLTSQVRMDQDQECVEIIVADTGIGIAKDDQEGIFEKFYFTQDLEKHSSGRTEFKAGGPGLGLSIARGIVLAHNGHIWVESDGYDEVSYPGSQFHILLPVA
ncbi:MAG: HAMP domain-containing histidine kinase, partial [Anaerolineales bacterium]